MAEEAIFGFVLETIGNLVIQEAQFLDGVEEQVKKVQQELNLMRWFLRDTASADPDIQKRVLEFVLQARNLAYEADYLIDSYAFKIASRRRGGIRGNLKRFAGLLNECYHRHKIGSNIDKILRKITDLTTSFDKYGIRQIVENKDNGASRRPLLRRTYSIFNDEDELFVGSDVAVNNLAEKLVSDQYRTVSLHGMGGLGKTTLARKVYHHPIVKKHFDGFSWVSISQQWEKDDVLRGILIKLMAQRREDIQKWRDEELVRELSKFLQARKCLLVLDDVWSSDAWESIKHALPIREDGSKVFMTTRNVDVANSMDGHGYLYSPPLLNEDESWELLCKKALRGQDSQKIKKMEQMGKEMVSQCGGLPLAVVALGGILSSKHGYDEWKNVGDNVKSYLRKDSNSIEGVQKILSLSYDDLPFQLKPCFLYLSQYEEDAEIEVETLYQYWMAEGMVSDQDMFGSNETMMDVAEHYLSELAERSMVFVKKEEEHSHTRFKSCRLHDLMRDMCISKAKEEKFLESIDYRNIRDGDEASFVPRTTSRLFIYLDDERDDKRFIPPAKTVSASLRSFTLVLGSGYFEKIPRSLKFKFREFMMLRRLSLDGFFDSSDLDYEMKFLSSIGKLVHLRYLSLRRMSFKSFLDMSFSMSNFKQLQTLDLRGSRIEWLLNVVWKFRQLHHLYLPDFLPRPSGDLLGLDGLHKLEILEGFDNKVYNVKHLSTLTSLRKLKAVVQDKLEDLETFIDDVSKLTHLRFLDLKIKNIIDLSSEKGLAIIRNILCCNNLVNLRIYGKLSKLPEYDGMFCRNLQSLELVGCEIEKDPLSTLERLPNLRSLIFGKNAFVGKEMTFHASGFPQLRILSFQYLENLEKWEIEDGAMPNLSKLLISNCSRLEMIPPGLRFTTSLKVLGIYEMPDEFKERVRVKDDGQEGADFDKVRHVQTISILY